MCHFGHSLKSSASNQPYRYKSRQSEAACRWALPSSQSLVLQVDRTDKSPWSERLVLTISDSDQDSASNYLEAIRRALGGVDLDRASCAEANRVVFCYLRDLGVISGFAILLNHHFCVVLFRLGTRFYAMENDYGPGSNCCVQAVLAPQCLDVVRQTRFVFRFLDGISVVSPRCLLSIRAGCSGILVTPLRTC